MHAFGAWLANTAAQRGWTGSYARDEIVGNINLYKASNGEEIHGCAPPLSGRAGFLRAPAP